jgi:short-subunit dehydrogenase
MAREAAQRGLNVVLVARRQAELDRLANELAQAHGVLARVRILGHVMGGMTRHL